MQNLSQTNLRRFVDPVRYAPAAFAAVLLLSPAYATITGIQIGMAPRPPQALGTTISLSVGSTDSDPGPVTYKWEVQLPGTSTYALVRDFSVARTLTWAPNYIEGTYSIRITARDYLAGTSAQRIVAFQATPLVSGSQAVVVPTVHPLVPLFSAPACPIGSTMQVVFQQQNSTTQNFTDWRPCQTGTMNFYISGLAPSTTYLLSYQTNTGGTVTGSPSISFTTGSIPSSLHFPSMSVPIAPGPGADIASGLVFSGYASSPYLLTATDLNANILWYYTTPGVQLTRPLPGGTILMIANGPGTGTGYWGPNVTRQQLLREIDLTGHVIREVSCDRIYEQLVAMGLTDPLGRFNHDAIRLSNGQTIVLGDAQRIFPAGTQGAVNPVDVVGALIIVLDQNFQVVSYWNAFDHDCSGVGCIDINRPAVRHEICSSAGGQSPEGCPPVLLSSPANDWLHANSIAYLSPDGDLLVSMRNQDWVVKIDYSDGAGTGNIIWRLGRSGDFALGNSAGQPYPWFSGQHDAGFVNDSEQTMLVFDNAVTLHSRYGGNSRGQAWTIDQTNMVASLTLNADLGVYSKSLGSAQLLTNGNYMFQSGNVPSGSLIEVQSTEVTPDAAMVYQFQSLGGVSYRGWRLTDFYHAPLNGSSGPQ